MIYYPVVIPTLNRADHLKRCIESLSQNTGCENTELFVSVDFPPAEKYVEGHNRVKEFLEIADFSAFKSVNIYYQEKNLGPVGNAAFLEEQIKDRFDAYIFSEDDNEFAPDFLEYINKGLHIFRDDESIVAVCGSKSTDWETDGKEILLSKLLAAYGVGFWIDKKDRIIKNGTPVILPEKPYGIRKMRRLYRQNAALFSIYILAILASDTGLFWQNGDTLYWCDTTYSLYMHFTDTACIAPATAKSRTWGNDGTGVNMPSLEGNPESKIPLDQSTHFEYENIKNLVFSEENYAIGNKYMPSSQINVLKAMICYLVLCVFGKNRKGAVRFLKLPKTIWKKLRGR